MSFQEGIFNRLPMIVIPFTGEQYRNGLYAERHGFGKLLEFDDLTNETLTAAIDEVLGSSFYKAVKTEDLKVNSNPSNPLRDSLYWISNAIEFRQSLKSPSVNFSWFKYHNLDIFGFYFVIFLITILFWIQLIRLGCKRWRTREEKGKFKYY
jgi:glucuronosyltransferase